jgi:hypothetical protein
MSGGAPAECRHEGAHQLSAETPVLSAIVLVPDRLESVETTLAALSAQDIADRMELVFVTPVHDLAIDPALTARFMRTTTVVATEWRSTSASRTAGIRAATAPIVAMVEDHCFPTPGWASALVKAHEQPWAGVGPTILNANPKSLVSWVNLAIEYGPWLHPVERGAVSHIPGHNSSYKRERLLEYGDGLEQIFEAESILHWDLQRRGYQVAMEPEARSRHQNFAQFWPSIGLRFHGGRQFAANRAESWSVVKRLAFAGGSAILPFLRTARTMNHMRRAAPRRAGPGFIATLFVLLVFDALGEAVGYATGRGQSVERLNDLEFNRRRFTAIGDEVATS